MNKFHNSLFSSSPKLEVVLSPLLNTGIRYSGSQRMTTVYMIGVCILHGGEIPQNKTKVSSITKHKNCGDIMSTNTKINKYCHWFVCVLLLFIATIRFEKSAERMLD